MLDTQVIPAKLLSKHIIRNGLYTELIDCIDYMQDYGDIALYNDDDKNKFKILIEELEEKFKQCNVILNQLNELVHDNYEY